MANATHYKLREQVLKSVAERGTPVSLLKQSQVSVLKLT